METIEMKSLNRRQFLSFTAGSAAAIVISSTGCNARLKRNPAAKRPNIIFIMSDDQRWDAMGCMGNTVIKTPNMDRLASDGVLFTNAFLTTSICMASRACVMLGQFEARHQCNFERPSNKTISYAEFDKSYPRLLQKAGYRIGFIGKFGFAVSKEKILNCPLNPDGSRDGKGHLWKKPEYMPSDKFDSWYGFPGQGTYFPKDKPGKHLTGIMGEQAAEFFQSGDPNHPFCLSISFKAPHGPHHPDPAYKDMYKDVKIPRQLNDSDEYFEKLPKVVRRHWRGRRVYYKEAGPENYQEFMERYYQCITGIDTVIGRIRNELKHLKLDDNTVIIYTSDNGYFLGSKGLGGKALLYEESIRTPLIIFDPRLDPSKQSSRCPQLVMSVDFAPTMLDIAGLKSPSTMQGKSLAPLLTDPKTKWRDSTFHENYFTSHFVPALADAGDWREKILERSVRCKAVRTKRYKYIRYFEQRPIIEELFDLQNDPIEANNVVGKSQYSNILASLREKCDDWIRKVK
jgi:arylsulfatase A-like enzyme